MVAAVLLAAYGKETAVLCPQFAVGHAPLGRTAIESSNAAAGNGNVELSAAHIEANVDGLHDHRFSGQRFGSLIVSTIVRRARKLQLKAPATYVAI